MSSGLTDDDKRRIESFCETPPYDRTPDDLKPGQEYRDADEGARDEASGSLLSKVVRRFRGR